MRTRDIIEEEEKLSKENAIVRDFSRNRELEVLLDIRDLLIESNKIEITGEPTGATYTMGCKYCKEGGCRPPH